MIDSLAPGNVLATVVVAFPFVSLRWIAPKLTKPALYTLVIWGVVWSVPFLIGQYCQEGKWGYLWMQYRLQDFTYTPWVTTFIFCVLSVVAVRRQKNINEKKFVASSVVLASLSGIATELWDTYDATIDFSDYIALCLGVAITIAPYVALRKKLF